MLGVEPTQKKKENKKELLFHIVPLSMMFAVGFLQILFFWFKKIVEFNGTFLLYLLR